MRVVVDRDLCESNGVCARRAPEVFSVDRKDQLHVLVERPGPELMKKVQDAVDRCPRGALRVIGDD